MADFQEATQFVLMSLKIDDIEVKDLFFSLSHYQNVMTSSVTGETVLVETTANPFLYEYNIEGNEKIEFSFKLPGDEFLDLADDSAEILPFNLKKSDDDPTKFARGGIVEVLI